MGYFKDKYLKEMSCGGVYYFTVRLDGEDYEFVKDYLNVIEIEGESTQEKVGKIVQKVVDRYIYDYVKELCDE